VEVAIVEEVGPREKVEAAVVEGVVLEEEVEATMVEEMDLKEEVGATMKKEVVLEEEVQVAMVEEVEGNPSSSPLPQNPVTMMMIHKVRDNCMWWGGGRVKRFSCRTWVLVYVR
jgi:hypothetical protein